MARRALLNVLTGVGALAALFFAVRAQASEGESIFDSFTGEMGMNYKVNEYPKYAAAIADAETRYGIPTDLLARLLYQESRYRTDIITGEKRSPVGAMGIAQFMPRTGEEYGLVDYSGSTIIADRRTDPFASIDAAGRYLRMLYRMFNNWQSALMAYNWGPGNVAKYNRGEAITVPLETSQYVAQITADVYVA
jgi:soluble lytic murein transglycosylase-like protein